MGLFESSLSSRLHDDCPSLFSLSLPPLLCLHPTMPPLPVDAHFSSCQRASERTACMACMAAPLFSSPASSPTSSGRHLGRMLQVACATAEANADNDDDDDDDSQQQPFDASCGAPSLSASTEAAVAAAAAAAPLSSSSRHARLLKQTAAAAPRHHHRARERRRLPLPEGGGGGEASEGDRVYGEEGSQDNGPLVELSTVLRVLLIAVAIGLLLKVQSCALAQRSLPSRRRVSFRLCRRHWQRPSSAAGAGRRQRIVDCIGCCRRSGVSTLSIDRLPSKKAAFNEGKTPPRRRCRRVAFFPTWIVASIHRCKLHSARARVSLERHSPNPPSQEPQHLPPGCRIRQAPPLFLCPTPALSRRRTGPHSHQMGMLHAPFQAVDLFHTHPCRQRCDAAKVIAFVDASSRWLLTSVAHDVPRGARKETLSPLFLR